jgi:transcriptional regulator with XRE-family HTH domain
MTERPDHLLVGVRTRRQYLRVGVKELAERLNMTESSYRRFERGDRRPYLDQAITIAKMLNCTVEALGHLPTATEVGAMFDQINHDKKLNDALAPKVLAEDSVTVVAVVAQPKSPPTPAIVDVPATDELLNDWGAEV